MFQTGEKPESHQVEQQCPFYRGCSPEGRGEQREDRVHTPCRAFPSKIAYKKCIPGKEEEL